MLRLTLTCKLPSLIMNRLDMTTKRSEVFLTGRNLLRGTLIPTAPLKFLMAAPAAVSSCITLVPLEVACREREGFKRKGSHILPFSLSLSLSLSHLLSVVSFFLSLSYLFINNDIHSHSSICHQSVYGTEPDPQIVCVENFKLRYRLKLVHLIYRPNKIN